MIRSNILDPGMAERLDNLETLPTEGVVNSSSLGCYGDFGVCMSYTVMEALREEAVGEREILGKVAEGLAEYLSTGDIANTWRSLREIRHVNMTEKCIRRFKSCQ